MNLKRTHLPLLKRLTTFCCAFLIAAGFTFAHHGTSLYDMKTEMKLTGTVKEWTFSNPHSWLWLNTAASDGTAAEWSIESAPPNYLARQGWSASTLKYGEKVTVLISPKRGEARSGILLEVTRSGGDVRIVRSRGAFGRPESVR